MNILFPLMVNFSELVKIAVEYYENELYTIGGGVRMPNIKPKIIKMDKRYIIGKFGSRGNRDDLLDLINERYAKNPFNKTDEYECNIYFWKSSPESKRPNYNSFFGYESDGAFKGKLFSTFEIPACEWAIFEVNPAQWWKYGDKDVEGWVANNDTYRWLTYKDAVFQFEYYREKFDGNKPDSLMEVWYPLENIQHD
ncbi:MAG: GyrI-like domain-containing protein [Oscillospiraceae bacterium]|jgi:predicted transcriptional regulator YdeE|nr:GyrI-like domain-containing protein [Oscillospiraceae bacterium]